MEEFSQIWQIIIEPRSASVCAVCGVLAGGIGGLITSNIGTLLSLSKII